MEFYLVLELTLGVIHRLTLKQDSLAGLLVLVTLNLQIKGELGFLTLLMALTNLALMGQNSPSLFLNPVPLLPC